jgi:plastocyanin
VRTPSQPALREVTVDMGSMYYRPDTIHALAGQPLMVTFVNNDTINHDFIIDRGTSGMIHMFVPKGRRIATSLFFGEPGTVNFICSQSGHQAAGMVGKIVVE